MSSIEVRRNAEGVATYRVKVRLSGLPIQTGSFRRLTDARRLAAQVETELRSGRHFSLSEASRHTVAELIERYEREVVPLKRSNASNIKHHFKWWSARIGATRLSDVTPALITQCRDELSRPDDDGKVRAPATVVRYLATLSHAFTVAMKEWQWVEDSPMRRVSKPREGRGRCRVLTDKERNKLLDACRASGAPALHAIVVLALATGMRRGEILGLTWDRVDLKRGHVTLDRTKNGDRRGVPLGPKAIEELRRLAPAEPGAQLVFPSPTKPDQALDIGKTWPRACSKAGISDFTFHDLRHCAASYLAMNGASLAEIAEVLGHKTLAMVKRYSHISHQHSRGVVLAMNDKIFATAPAKEAP